MAYTPIQYLFETSDKRRIKGLAIHFENMRSRGVLRVITSNTHLVIYTSCEYV